MATIFLVTPFAARRAEDPKTFEAVQHAIRLAAKRARVALRHPKEDRRAGFVWDQIVGDISRADLVMVVVGRTWNVLIELGVALAVSRRPPILICRSPEKIRKQAFDIAHMRQEPYGGGELETLATRLQEAIRSTLREPERRSGARRAGGTRLKADTLRKVFLHVDQLGGTLLGSGFKDREPYRNNAKAWLREGSVRLMCIWGRPGVGRSALVQRVLWELESEAREGAAPEDGTSIEGVVYLSAKDVAGKRRAPEALLDDLFLGCAALVGGAAERRLCERWSSGGNVAGNIASLADELSKGFYVVAIDDVECLLDDDGRFRTEYADVEAFLDATMKANVGARIVLTSQRRLHVEGADTARVRQSELDALPTEAAIELLLDLDQDGSLGLKNAPRERLERMVRLAHGVPKALHLLYGLFQQRPTQALDELEKTFYANPDVVAALAHEQLDRLDPRERAIVALLSVFGEPVPVADICELLAGERTASQSSIDRLVRFGLAHYDASSSLLSVDPVTAALVYAGLPESGSEMSRTALHRRAADYFAKRHLPVERWQAWGDVAAQVVEFAHRVTIGDFDGAARVIDGFDYGWVNHHKFVARSLLWGKGRTAAAMRESLVGKLSPPLEIRNLAALGWMYRRIGEPEKALERLRLGAGLATGVDDHAARMFVLTELAFLLNDRFAEQHEARALLVRVLEEAREKRERYWEGIALLGLAYTEFDFGKDDAALAHATAALDAFRETEKPLRVLDARVRLGMIHRKLKHYEEALAEGELGLREAIKAHSRLWEAEVQSAFGFHHRAAGAYGRALEGHDRALELYRGEAPSLREEAVQRSYRANLLLDLGRTDEAIGEYRSALAICRDIGIVHEQSWILAGFGIGLTRIGCHAVAEKVQLEAHAIVDKARNLRSKVIRATDLAATALALAQPERALMRVREALRTAAQVLEREAPDTLPEAFVKAPYLADALPHEMQAPGDHQRRGLIAARAYLDLDRLDDALTVAAAARSEVIAVPVRRPDAAVIQGVVLHRLGLEQEARDCYDDALRTADSLLKVEPRLYTARAAQGIALAGLSLLARGADRTRCLERSKAAFRLAWKDVEACGVFQDARSLVCKMPGATAAFWTAVMGRAPNVPSAAQCARLLKR